MSGPVKPLSPIAPSIMKIDKPHEPYGQHVDIITPFGGGADKMRVDTNGNPITHELLVKGGYKTPI